MDGLTIFHEPGSYDIKRDRFFGPCMAWVRMAARSFPSDDGWRIWQAENLDKLSERVCDALGAGQISDYR